MSLRRQKGDMDVITDTASCSLEDGDVVTINAPGYEGKMFIVEDAVRSDGDEGVDTIKCFRLVEIESDRPEPSEEPPNA